jgi:hypothetical protein
MAAIANYRVFILLLVNNLGSLSIQKAYSLLATCGFHIGGRRATASPTGCGEVAWCPACGNGREQAASGVTATGMKNGRDLLHAENEADCCVLGGVAAGTRMEKERRIRIAWRRMSPSRLEGRQTQKSIWRRQRRGSETLLARRALTRSGGGVVWRRVRRHQTFERISTHLFIC